MLKRATAAIILAAIPVLAADAFDYDWSSSSTAHDPGIDDPHKSVIGHFPNLPTNQRFHARQMEIGNSYGGNSVVVGILVPPGKKAAFPTALTTFAEMASAGNQAFALYAPAYLMAPGVSTNEIDAFNYSGDAPASYPWNRGFGTKDNLAIAISCIMDGPYVDATCMEIGHGKKASGQFGVVVRAGAVRQAALLVDAEDKASPRIDIVLRHSGATGEPIIEMETKDSSVGDNPIIVHKDREGHTTFQLNQDGSIVGPIRSRSYFQAPLRTPKSSSACAPGDFVDDSNYHYVCTAVNHWRRIRLVDY